MAESKANIIYGGLMKNMNYLGDSSISYRQVIVYWEY